MARETTVVVVRKLDVPNPPVDYRADAECDFCGEKCWINKYNLRELKSKGQTPVLVCVPCYQNGNHIKGGYRG